MPYSELHGGSGNSDPLDTDPAVGNVKNLDHLMLAVSERFALEPRPQGFTPTGE